MTKKCAKQYTQDKCIPCEGDFTVFNKQIQFIFSLKRIPLFDIRNNAHIYRFSYFMSSQMKYET